MRVVMAAPDKLKDLRSLSTSPYPPEPPRRKLAVNFVLRLLGERKLGGLTTPHLHGGSDRDKVAYEYAAASDFVAVLGRYLDLDIYREKDVLDVGCGWGGKAVHCAEKLGPRSVTGFDLPNVFRPDVPERFARERGLTGVAFSVGRAEAIPFDDERFDLAVVEDVLEHVADPAQVLRECHRVLRPGGSVIAMFPSFRMFHAHHLDRVLTLPGAHYLLPLRAWARGLNYLLASSGMPPCEPFDEVVDTPFRKGVTRNLNGMDYGQFRAIVARSGFDVRVDELVPFRPRRTHSLKARAYDRLHRVPALREVLAYRVLFVGIKPGVTDAARTRSTTVRS